MTIRNPRSDRSYRALFDIPDVGRLLIGMQIARIAQSMVSVTIVLFTLAAYKSSTLSGIATFFSIFPGLLVSPIGGALLDRHGRVRLVALDYFIALLSLTSIGALAVLGILPAWLLILIAAVASLTTPLSATGLRSLFPLIIPHHLWERINAIDSTGYVIATVVGPPLGAGLVAIFGGAATFVVIGVGYGVAAIVIARAQEPKASKDNTLSSGRLLTDAWNGLVYTWRNRTLRGLGFSISALNLANGAFTIIVPLLVLRRFYLNEAAVGLVFAVQGVSGVIAAFVCGQIDTRNRERFMLGVPMALTAVTIAMLLVDSNVTVLGIVMLVTGFLNGPIDIALFTLRQRRTDPSWTGRAFAVSMSFNYAGTPIGSAIAGALASVSIDAAIVFAVVTSAISGGFVATMIPSNE